jgi:hypothetical protein
MKSRFVTAWVLVCSAVMALSGCGGGGGDGGGGGGGGTPTPVAPTISTAPASVTIDVGQSANFSVVANGDAPLAYQWQQGGTDIAGATSANLSLTPTASTPVPQEIRVRVTNAAGSVTSAAALLTVRDPLVVTPVTLAAGYGYTLAVRADGRVLAWGQMHGGSAAGDTNSLTPLLLTGLADVRAVTADGSGNYRSLALVRDGSAVGWGEASPFGANPASGGTAFVAPPTAMPLLGASRQAVHCGAFAGEGNPGAAFTFMLRVDGTVAYAPAAVTRPATGPHSSSSALVPGLSNVVTLVEHHSANSCRPHAIKADGTIWKLEATLTDTTDAATGTQVRSYAMGMTQITGLPAVRSGSCGGFSGIEACVVVANDGTVWAWGHISYSSWLPGPRIGTTAYTAPAQMPVLANVVEVSTGDGAVAFARDQAGALWSWSAAGGGVFRLGRGDGSGDVTPRIVALPAAATHITSSASHAAALLDDGTVWTWGRTQWGQRGDGTQETVTLEPFQVPGVNLR